MKKMRRKNDIESRRLWDGYQEKASQKRHQELSLKRRILRNSVAYGTDIKTKHHINASHSRRLSDVY